jgi:hypothetical protein
MRNVFVMVLSFSAVGCATGPALDAGEELDASGKADSASTVRGFYFNRSGQIGDLASLTLFDDSTFERTVRMVDCMPQKACEPERGLFVFSHTAGHTYVRFSTQDHVLIDRYEYTVDGKGGLALRKDDGAHWFSMQKDPLAGVKDDLEFERAHTADLTAAERAQLPASVAAAEQLMKPLDTNPTDEGPITQRLTYQGDTYYTVSQYVEQDDRKHGFVFDAQGQLVASADWDSADNGWAFEDPMQTPAEVAARSGTP